MKYEVATFGAGCFWHVQLAFSKIQGVVKTEAGYMGGEIKNPTYEQVCSDKTGHIEVVQVTYDPDKVSYLKLLEIFWKNHNPTERDRQGPDIGTQYRSVIFFHTNEQKKQAEMSKKEIQKSFSKQIQTKILKAEEFYKAEEYHQDYLKKHGRDSCYI